MTRDELKFRWEAPVEGDRWNTSAFASGPCVSVGRIDAGQVVARVFMKSRKPWGKEYEVWHVHHEDKGGAGGMFIRGGFWTAAIAQSFAEDHLFGALTSRIRCASCGELARVDGYTNTARLRERGLCFGCDIWIDRIAQLAKSPPNVALIDGVWYTVDPRENMPSHCKGFGGARSEIEWLDGRKAVTTNLWRGGDAPTHLRDQLPDNARFVTTQAVTEFV